MKNFGRSFIISVVFGVTSLVLIVLGYHLFAAIAAVAAFLMNFAEVSSHTSIYQFINFRAHTLLLGIAIDMAYGGTSFYYTVAMLLFPFTGLLRLELFSIMAFNRFYGVEIFGLVSVYALYFYAGLQHPSSWIGWAMPAVPMMLMTMIGTGVIADALKANKTSLHDMRADLGKKAPDFCLPDTQGQNVNLSDFKDKNHVLLVFVRGDWCPTCHIMIRTYEQNREKFLSKNIVAIGIGPDSAEVNRAMISRLGFKNMLLSDTHQKVSSDYGITFFPNYRGADYDEGVPLPAAFLVDKGGIVRYVSRPDKVGEFLNPSLIFPILEKLN